MNDVDPVALSIFLFFFLLVTVLGFLAARWRKAETLDNLDEWGLGGRSFGTFIAWFLIGGDIYTAYTFIAVPALLYAGNATGFFAVPYTIILYPIIFIFLPRLWSVSHRRSYVTPADFVQGRFDSRGLSLAIAFTGILATLPYIALQLVGIQAVLDVMGLGGGEDASWFRKDIPLFVAFALLAAYTYSSGLRAPALIAFVKDTLIYLVIIVAVIYLPTQLGGWSGIFDSAGKAFDSFNQENADAIAAGEASPKGLIPGMGSRSGRTPRCPSARRSRCSCIRTRSPRSCRPRTATSSGATRPCSRRTRSCWACSPCSASPRWLPASRSRTRSWRSRSCSSRSSRRGSPASRSPRS
ncbi:hypothetical protein [Aeromicrobium sp. NPDC092404]|uniref:sodium:solute symporter family protein n=1 Tax=Aeromicrobium sp. NPDC092404 TaxID=3154976 RepID=UPI00342D137E